MVTSIFIDGAEGTTGLQIRTRLEGREDISLLTLGDADRKDAEKRAAMLNACDIAILCLPDDAAREAVAMIDNPDVRVIDASTAHRTAAGWDYGFPEMDPGQAAVIAASKRVANTGCYAVASVAILHPLVADGVLPADWPVTINAVSGYSGGGKKMIAGFEDPNAENKIDTPYRVYGLNLGHKHIPEIQHWAGLNRTPIFVPSVGRYREGMIVQVPLHLAALPGAPSAEAVHDVLLAHYEGRRFVTVADLVKGEGAPVLDPEELNGTNELRLHVYASKDGAQAVVCGVLDNLGKGASGQAVQCLNLMMGAPEEAGLLEPVLL
ncbi:MAG: N-acetyl-gamma-glutamyl-phosphate reductase [Rhodospirillales bacterium]|nr:N-acetyl-gamma-glutamyl-phosphate reductase [Rhodospirillales bacterium]MBO6786963.1 N-acetyl-gamma-glutamyl-phosphate reductase [Rhodospirillales bacterium]